MAKPNEHRIPVHRPMMVFLDDPDIAGAERKWVSLPATRDVKQHVREIGEEIEGIAKAARVAAGLPETPEFVTDDAGHVKYDAENNALLADPVGEATFELSDEADERILELIAGQVSAMTKPDKDTSRPLGEELMARWRGEVVRDGEPLIVTDDQIVELRSKLRAHLGNPSAS